VLKTLKTSVCTEDVFCLLKLLESRANTTFSAYETFPLPAPPIAKQEDLGAIRAMFMPPIVLRPNSTHLGQKTQHSEKNALTSLQAYKIFVTLHPISKRKLRVGK